MLSERIHRIRYAFEFYNFPKLIYDSTEKVVLAILNRHGELIYSLMKWFFDDEQLNMPYQLEDFEVFYQSVGDEVHHIMILMPDPETVPDCYAIHILTTSDFSKVEYYTVEHDFDENRPHLCGVKFNEQGEFII